MTLTEQQEQLHARLAQAAVKEWLEHAFIYIDADGAITIEGDEAKPRQRKKTRKLKEALLEHAVYDESGIEEWEISKLLKMESMLLGCVAKLKRTRMLLEADRPNRSKNT